MFSINVARQNTEKYKNIIEKIDTAIETASLTGKNYVYYKNFFPPFLKNLYIKNGYVIESISIGTEELTFIRW